MKIIHTRTFAMKAGVNFKTIPGSIFYVHYQYFSLSKFMFHLILLLS